MHERLEVGRVRHVLHRQLVGAVRPEDPDADAILAADGQECRTQAPALPAVDAPTYSIGASTLAGLFVGAAMTASTIVFSGTGDRRRPDDARGRRRAAAGRHAARQGDTRQHGAVAGGGRPGVHRHAVLDVGRDRHSASAGDAVPGARHPAALAAYIADDPEPRFELVMWCCLAASLIATGAAIAGYFSLLPGSYDLFTNYGRARGTFKDPNVYGAMLVPALAFVLWQVLRGSGLRLKIAARSAPPLLLGLLLALRRAWISMAVAGLLMMWLSVVRTRRRDDRRRFGWVAGLGAVAILFTIGPHPRSTRCAAP